MKYQITALEGPVVYGRSEPPKMVAAEIEAFSFKVNDQGTIVFVDRFGGAVASFKHWLSVQPAVEDVRDQTANMHGIDLDDPAARPLVETAYVDRDPRGEPRFPLR